MSKVILVGFDTEKQAREGERVLREMHRDGAITLYTDAIVVRDRDGKVGVRQQPKARPTGLVGGLITGGLIGLLGGGPVGAAVGGGTGALAGGAVDATREFIDRDFVTDVCEHLALGRAALIAEIAEDREGPLNRRMEAVAGTYLRRMRSQVDDVHFEQLVEISREELARLEAK